MSWIELLGFATGVLCVWLTAIQNIWCWLVGLANNAFFLALFLGDRLYADALLQAIYILLGLYGWWYWLHGGGNRATLSVSRTPRAAWPRLGLLFAAGTAALALLLSRGAGWLGVPPPDLLWWDAPTTVACLIAQYLLTRKWLATWVIWIGTNLSYIGLYAVKGRLLIAAWMRELCPGAAVHHVAEEHRVDFADPAAWELWIGAIRRVLPAGPDFVFSSEGYGDELARRLGARHVLFDRERAAPPVSATMIREAPLAHWEALPPCVRPHFALRVAVVGAESTGKTTLARALAARFATSWAPEFARGYLQERGGSCRPEDLPAIARGQADAEGRLAREADRVLFCDTDLLTTALWSERYFGEVDGEVRRLAAGGRYGLTLLCENDLPWVGDGLRDSPGHRAWFRGRFEAELDARGRPWRPVAGTGEARTESALSAVASLLASSP